MDHQTASEQQLFQSLHLGTLTLPNRVVMTAVKLGYATKKGETTDRHIAFYVRWAQGGASLIVAEPLSILPSCHGPCSSPSEATAHGPAP